MATYVNDEKPLSGAHNQWFELTWSWAEEPRTWQDFAEASIYTNDTKPS